MTHIPAYVLDGKSARAITLAIEPMTQAEKESIRCGSLISYNRVHK